MKISSIHLHSQIVRACKLTFGEKVHVPPNVMCHLSHIMCHGSCVSFHKDYLHSIVSHNPLVMINIEGWLNKVGVLKTVTVIIHNSEAWEHFNELKGKPSVN